MSRFRIGVLWGCPLAGASTASGNEWVLPPNAASNGEPVPWFIANMDIDRPIIAPRRDVRAYPYVVPQEGVVVETVRPYRWRWDLAPDPLF